MVMYMLLQKCENSPASFIVTIKTLENIESGCKQTKIQKVSKPQLGFKVFYPSRLPKSCNWVKQARHQKRISKNIILYYIILYFKLRCFSGIKGILQKYLTVFGLFFKGQPLFLKYKKKCSQFFSEPISSSVAIKFKFRN